MELTEFRKQYPQYDDMPDSDLIVALKKRSQPVPQKLPRIKPAERDDRSYENLGGVVGSFTGPASPVVSGVLGQAGYVLDRLQAGEDPKPFGDMTEEQIGKITNYSSDVDVIGPMLVGQTAFGRQSVMEGVGKAVIPPVVRGVLKTPNAIKQGLVKLFRPNMITGAKEVQEQFLIKVADKLALGEITEEEAKKATLTIGQLSNPHSMQKLIEDISQGSLTGKGIGKVKDFTAPIADEMIDDTVRKVTSGVKLSADTVNAPINIINPLQRTGTKTSEQFGKSAGEAGELGLKIFKETSNKIADSVSNISKEAFGGEKILDITDITNGIFSESKESKYFDFIGNTTEGKNIKRAISDIIRPYTGGIKQVIKNDKYFIDRYKLTLPQIKEVAKSDKRWVSVLEDEIGGDERVLTSYDEGINLYRQLNNEFGRVMRESKAEQGTLENIFRQIKSDLLGVMENAANTAGKPEVHSAFVGYTEWFKKGIEPFQTKVADKVINGYKENPSEIIKFMTSPNAVTNLENIKQITGKESGRVLKEMKNTYIQNLYDNAYKLDDITKQMIPDPTVIHEAIKGLDPTVKKMLFKGNEVNQIIKSANEDLARTYAKKAMVSSNFIGDFEEDVAKKTVKYTNKATSERELNFIVKTLPKEESEPIVKEIGDKWFEGLIENSKKEDVWTKKITTDNKKILSALRDVSSNTKKILFSGRKTEYDAFKTAVENNLITQAPSEWGHIGAIAIGMRQVAAASQIVGGIGLASGSAAFGSGHEKFGTGLTVMGTVLLLGPVAAKRIFTNPEFVNLVLKIEKPTLEQIPKKATYIRTLMNFLSSDPALVGEFKLLNMTNERRKEINDFPSAKDKISPLQRAGTNR